MIKARNWALTILLAFSALAIGSVHGWAIATCCAMAGIVYSLEVVPGLGKASRPRTPGIFGMLAIALLAFTAFQLVPLPAGVVAFLSPHAFEVRSSLHADLLGGEAPAWMPLTVDVAGTTVGLARTLAATLLFLAVRHRVRSEGSRGVLSCVATSGMLVAIVSLVHRLTGWDKVYDWYVPQYLDVSPLPAPFPGGRHVATVSSRITTGARSGAP